MDPARKKVKPVIGFVGQGFVGKSYADDFEKRRFTTIRYSLEKPYRKNKDLIKDADIVFVCVPAPTTPRGFDASVVEASLRLVGTGNIAVIKSTMLPGTTRVMQKKFPKITVIFSPEFLNSGTAAHDASRPFSNIIGIPATGRRHARAAQDVHALLPKAAFAATISSEEAEIYKYAHNVSGYMQILTYNMMYDLAERCGADWGMIQKALQADPMVSNWYIRPVHKKGRGAGGLCFIKDFAAFADIYARKVPDADGVALLKAAEKLNIALLVRSKKDLDLVRGVYGVRGIQLQRSRAKKRR